MRGVKVLVWVNISSKFLNLGVNTTQALRVSVKVLVRVKVRYKLLKLGGQNGPGPQGDRKVPG